MVISNDYNMLHEVIKEVSKIIRKRKEGYHYHLASKLNNPSASAKTYWSIFKTFYKVKKYHLFPQLKLTTPWSRILRRKQASLISYKQKIQAV